MTEAKVITRNRNKQCMKCGWKTFSWISFNYVYCPHCGGPLTDFEM